MEVRPALPGDLPAILVLLAACRTALVAQGIDQWDALYPDEAGVRADLVAGSLFLAEQGGAVVGTFALGLHPEPAYEAVSWQGEGPFRVLHRLAVAPEAQGQGFGRRLVAAAEAEALRQGARVLRLDVYEGHPRAVALYQATGYRACGTLRFPRRSQAFLAMEKRLGAP